MNQPQSKNVIQQLSRALDEEKATAELFRQYIDWISFLSKASNVKNKKKVEESYKYTLHTYNLVSKYTQGDSFFDSYFSPLGESHVKILCLLRHVPVPKHLRKATSKDDLHPANVFWNVLDNYSKIYEKVVNTYSRVAIVDFDNFTKIDLLDDQDIAYLKLTKALVSQSSGSHKCVENIFYFLMFFEFFSMLEMAFLSNLDSKLIKSTSIFCLRILPHLIGTYRFGEYHNQLNDYAFISINEEGFSNIEKQVRSYIPTQDERNSLISKIEAIAEGFDCRILVDSRIKGVFSAFMKSHIYALPIQRLWDLFAIRLVLDSSEVGECYRMLSELEKKWKRWGGKKGFFDYIAKPKENGYQSIHIVIVVGKKLVEVQIRTKIMDYIAEFGSASHLSVYKAARSSVAIPDLAITPVSKGRKILKKTLATQGLVLDDFIEHLQRLGNVLDVVPLEYYYEGIAAGKYDANDLVAQIKKKERK